MKFNLGSVQKDDKKKNITVKSGKIYREKVILGLVGTVASLIFTARAAFKEGARAYEVSEFNALVDIGVIDESNRVDPNKLL